MYQPELHWLLLFLWLTNLNNKSDVCDRYLPYGDFKIYDAEVDENIIFAILYVFSDYSMLFMSCNVGEVSYKTYIGTSGFRIKIENVVKTSNLVISHRCCAEDRTNLC